MAQTPVQETETRARLAVCRKIIERYADAINAGEQKTIPELKQLVCATDEAVRQARAKIIAGLGLRETKKQAGEQTAAEAAQTSENLGLSQPVYGEQYRFEKDFPAAAENAYNYVQSFAKVHHDLPVSFWLRARDIVEIGAADSFDRTLFLCSLLLSLGCSNAKIRVLELEGGLKHPVVVFTHNEKQHLFDACQECSAYTYHGTLEQIMIEYSFEGKKPIKPVYEFNNEEYVEFD